MTDKCTPQLYNKSPPAAIKKAVRKRFSADAFSRRALLWRRVFLVPPVWVRRFKFRIVRCASVCAIRLSFARSRFGLFLGVSLSAAARSAAALVYDKLTPNCQLGKNQYAP